jgi:membrane associated rhomboid family serine protease
MLIPLGHEQRSVRRLPWVTFTFMALCLLVFVLTAPGDTRRRNDAFDQLEAALQYFFEHPYLELQPRFRNILVGEMGEETLSAQLEAMRRVGPDPPSLGRALQQQQEQFDELVGEFFSTLGRSSSRALGLVPVDVRLHSFLTYQFAHGGWWHLIGNLFILFLAGPFIEDVWGRPLFGVFYLAAGAFSGLMFVLRYPSLDAPLIGASGAIAGVMGAFLIRYWHTKIRFFYWFFFFFVGTFDAPAWLMLPLWFFKELFFAHAMDTIAPGRGGGPVAFWAHVWGFVFGVVVAYAISHFKVEERFIHSTIESKITLVDNTAVETAAQMAESGDTAGAIDALEKELLARPENVDAAVALWNICFAREDLAPAVPHMVAAIRRAAKNGFLDFVFDHWQHLLRAGVSVELEPLLGLRIAEIFAERNRTGEASDTLAMIKAQVDETAPAPVQLRLARLAIGVESPHAAKIIDVAMANPDLTPEERSELQTARTAFGSAPADVQGDGDEEPEEARHTLHTMIAVPTGVSDGTLHLEVKGNARTLPLESIQAVAVCGVARSKEPPVLLVDLLLDAPWGNRAAIRTVRILSNSFDPRDLVGGRDQMQAFRGFLKLVLDISRAVPLPDPDSARGRPFCSFTTIGAYEKEVLNIGA